MFQPTRKPSSGSTSASLHLTPMFLNRQAAARYRALASIIPGHRRFSWNLSF